MHKKDARVALPRDSAWTEHPERAAEEWDFRQVRIDQLEAAILYEYARSSDTVRKVFKQWHEKRFRPRKEDASLSEWSGQTVREILRRNDEIELPPEVTAWLIQCMPAEFETHSLLDVWRISSKFPDPFLNEALPETSHVDRQRYRSCPAFWEVKAGQPNPPAAWLLNSPPSSSYVLDDGIHEDLSFLRQFSVVVDLRFAKSSIKEQIGEWLERIDVSKVNKFNLGKGKAASVPWFQLKELAAYRLSREARMKYQYAQAFTRDYLKKHPMHNAPDVLPIYSASAFSEACKKAQARIQSKALVVIRQ